MTADTLQSQSHGPQPLRRIPTDRLLGGVAAGLAQHFSVDVAIVRLGFVLLAVVGGFGLPLYVACWLLIPEEGSNRSVLSELLSPAPLA